MAVYTQVSAEVAEKLLMRYDIGRLVSLKGIAEGVENSNYLLDTDQARFILTLYENRVDPSDLPYFHNLLAHLHAANCPVPRFIEDRQGNWLQELFGRKACIIEFLPGISISQPKPAQARAVGEALGSMHNALADFTENRTNPLGIDGWRPLFDKCDRSIIDSNWPGLSRRIETECDFLCANWPRQLPLSATHTDLFPDNVLFRGNKVGGLIDFYFACSELRAYDLAVTHASWSFSADGETYLADIGEALVAGYTDAAPLSVAESKAMSVLARGASLRFLLTRLYDWINTPAGALVTRKDPLAFLKRLEYYSDAENQKLFG